MGAQARVNLLGSITRFVMSGGSLVLTTTSRPPFGVLPQTSVSMISVVTPEVTIAPTCAGLHVVSGSPSAPNGVATTWYVSGGRTKSASPNGRPTLSAVPGVVRLEMVWLATTIPPAETSMRTVATSSLLSAESDARMVPVRSPPDCDPGGGEHPPHNEANENPSARAEKCLEPPMDHLQ